MHGFSITGSCTELVSYTAQGFFATVGGGDIGLRAGDDLPHDFVDKNSGEETWQPYKGRIGSLARQRTQAAEVDQSRLFQSNVAHGEVVSGPDHRKWSTLPPDFAASQVCRRFSSPFLWFFFGAME